MHLQTLYSTIDYVEQNCHVLVATMYNFNLACQLTKLKENLKYWEQTRNMKKLLAFTSYFVHLGTFIAILLRGNVHVWLGFTKMQSPGIGTVLHWRPPNVHICGTDPSLPLTMSFKILSGLFLGFRKV